MTLWIDDGSEDGLLVNCGNCVWAVEEPTEDQLRCGWNPPAVVVTGIVVGFSQPTVAPEQHCHHHPAIQRVFQDRIGPDWQEHIKRPEDVEK